MKGYHELSAKYDTPLLGGDTTRSLKHLAINVCVIGKCKKGKARKRSMAEVGDAVCVTGTLGDSAGGLQVLLNKLPPFQRAQLFTHQTSFTRTTTEGGVVPFRTFSSSCHDRHF